MATIFPIAERRSGLALVRALFGSWISAAITFGYLLLFYFLGVPVLRWATIDATWSGTASDCAAGHGACWAFVAEKLRFMLFGLYPQALDWQAAAASGVIIALVVISAIPRFWHARLIGLWVLAIPLAVLLMSGTLTGNPVSTQKWGGFPLTLLLSVVGCTLAFPLGILLALGRRSRFGLGRLLCVGFIEVMRGVPLIAVLYVSTLLFPLMLPEGATVDKLFRAQVAIILFVSAYMAEIVRSGLASIPVGQLEAARAIGLGWWQAMRAVVLPQALRAVIPAFVTLGIGIFLDTTLVIVIGLFDFLNTARLAATDSAWLGFYAEAYAFAALVYFTISFAFSRYSLWLERRLAAGHSD